MSRVVEGLGMLAGGIGLFLLGITTMTNGLKVAAGPALEHILRRATRTPMAGLLSGILVTALVQSSSAVTVAVIGFVNRVYTWLIEAGYRVPEDVAFACLNVWPGEPYSGMSVQHDQVPRSAVDFLISQMHENQSGRPKVQHCLLLEPDWVEGSTLPDRRAVGAAPALV